MIGKAIFVYPNGDHVEKETYWMPVLHELIYEHRGNSTKKYRVVRVVNHFCEQEQEVRLYLEEIKETAVGD